VVIDPENTIVKMLKETPPPASTIPEPDPGAVSVIVFPETENAIAKVEKLQLQTATAPLPVYTPSKFGNWPSGETGTPTRVASVGSGLNVVTGSSGNAGLLSDGALSDVGG